MIREMHASEYPTTLKNMKSPPKRLFVRGRFPMPEDQKYLCIVGSRKWTEYGKDAVNRIVKGLAGYPISIVSGLAFGIDSISHTAALEAGLHCIAFPGSSLEWNELYPPDHIDLAQKIVDSGGALLSEWASGYPTGRWAFPARNRLMAGLSHAVLIIEAAHKSGSLMTAKHAEEFNRDVLAVPGPIDSSRSYGPHMLIQRGAALVSSSYDVLETLGFEVVRPIDDRTTEPQQIRKLPDHVIADPLALSILEKLGRNQVSIDSLLESAQISVQALNEKLTVLELEGMIRIDGAQVARRA